MTSPSISVVIPTYNRASLLMRAIESAVNQSHEPLEIIVADDGSTDHTARSVAAIGDPVRHLPLTHTGRPGYTRNRALEQTLGEYVAFLDDDDMWQPQKLAMQTEVLAANPNIGLVFTNGCFRFGDGTLSDPLFTPPIRQGNMFSGLLRHCFIHPSTVVARKTVIDDAGRFDENLSTIEDFDLWLRIARRCDMMFLPETLVTIQRHESQLSTTKEHETWNNMLRVLAKVRSMPNLSMSDRLRTRRTLAKTYNHLARLAADDKISRHYWKAIQWNPLTRAGWRGLARTFWQHDR